MTDHKTISNKLIRKLSLTFLFIILLVGITYVLITAYFTNKYFEETTQKLNAEIANHLIEEKFQDQSPFLDDGGVNKALFGDLMHDMMAVNHGIEVYLLDESGFVLYSVVLNHSPNEPMKKVSLEPVKTFIDTKGEKYITGDDPLNPGQQKIFSAAHFTQGQNSGYIYIILAGKEFDQVTNSLFASYFVRLGSGTMITALIFVLVLGLLAIRYLTQNLREIIFTVKRFQEGDLTARINNAEETDLSTLSVSFNHMADTIVDNIDKIQSVDNLRRELIANVSHDLRTPLAVIQGYIETLQMKNKTLSEEEKKKYLDILQNSSEKLSNLINQLFEYSKFEAKQVEPVKEPFVISDLAMDVYHKYSMLAEKKSIKVHIETEENLPLVFGDIKLVERAIQNLMDNALKYTPENGDINIALSSSSESVEIQINDSGPGIPKEEQSYIFERYKKASSSAKVNNSTGLGLAIVKKILEIHDSTIRVISSPNNGTTFKFWLPVYNDRLVTA